MQLSGLSYVSAPQATGQPPGLPGARDERNTPAKVVPILDARNPETQLGSQNAPTGFWRAVQGEPDPNGNIAPPTIMQMKISRMLNEQAQDLPQPAPVEAEATKAQAETDADADARDMSLASPEGSTADAVQTADAAPAPSSTPETAPTPGSTPAPIVLPEAPAAFLALAATAAGDDTAGLMPIDIALPAYAEAASISRSAVFKTLP